MTAAPQTPSHSHFVVQTCLHGQTGKRIYWIAHNQTNHAFSTIYATKSSATSACRALNAQFPCLCSG